MILVDQALWPWRGKRWAHLISDSDPAELHDFAESIGKRRAGFQGDHYDVTSAERDNALRLGAVEVESRELVRRLNSAGLRLRGGLPKWTTHYNQTCEASAVPELVAALLPAACQTQTTAACQTQMPAACNAITAACQTQMPAAGNAIPAACQTQTTVAGNAIPAACQTQTTVAGNAIPAACQTQTTVAGNALAAACNAMLDSAHATEIGWSGTSSLSVVLLQRYMPAPTTGNQTPTPTTGTSEIARIEIALMLSSPANSEHSVAFHQPLGADAQKLGEELGISEVRKPTLSDSSQLANKPAQQAAETAQQQATEVPVLGIDLLL